MQASLTCWEVQCHSVLPGDCRHAPGPSKSELGDRQDFSSGSLNPNLLLSSAVPATVHDQCLGSRSIPGVTSCAMAKVKDA